VNNLFFCLKVHILIINKSKKEILGHILKCAMEGEKAGGKGDELKAYFIAKSSS